MPVALYLVANSMTSAATQLDKVAVKRDFAEDKALLSCLQKNVLLENHSMCISAEVGKW